MIDQRNRVYPRSLNLSLPRQYRERLNEVAVERGLSIAEIIRRAVDALLGTEPTSSSGVEEAEHGDAEK